MKNNKEFPAIPFSKLLSEKILPFGGSATLTGDQQAFEDGILLLSQEMVVLFSNQQALDLLSTKNSKLVGRRLDIDGLGKHTNLLHIVDSEKSERIIELHTNLLEIEGTSYILAILQDITRQFEDTQRLNIAIDATELGLWDNNYTTNSTSINPYYATMLGYTFEEFESSNWINLVHKLDIEDVWKSWNAHIAGQVPIYQSEYRILTKNGRWKWIRARGQVKDRNANGEPLHFIGSHQDITVQKQAQRELQLQSEINVISNELTTQDQKLEKILCRILPILLVDKGMIHLFDQEKNLILGSSANLSMKEIYDLEGFSDQVLKSVGEERKVLTLNKASKLDRQFLKAAGAEMAAIYPLRMQAQSLGTLSIFWKISQPLTDLDDYIANVAANQLAVSVERESLRHTAEMAALSEERQRLARELHDSLSQSLYSVLLSADGGQDYARLGDSEKTEEIFKNIKETLQQTLREMRLLIYQLQPSILTREGLHQAIQRRLESVEKRAGISIYFDDNLSSILPGAVEAQLYGIVQEALNNVLKHALASSVRIVLDQNNDSVSMQVMDDGCGFDNKQNLTSGFGITNMKERARQLGGSLEIKTKHGHGTQISVCIPMKDFSKDAGMRENCE